MMRPRQRERPPRHSSSLKQQRKVVRRMEAPVFDRGKTADISLWFDGYVSHSAALPFGPPGGYGGVVDINGQVFDITCRLGHTTKDVAECMGLIGCMRGVLRTLQAQGMRHHYSSLIVKSDSDVAIDYLQGQYKVDNPRLQILCYIIKSLQREFNSVSYTKIGRHENLDAYKLATQGREDFSRTSIAVYHPNLKGMVDVWIEGVRTLGSNDIDSSGKDPSFMIDSRFLKSIPGGKALLRNMKDPYPLSLIRGKVNMTVLGTIQLYCGVRCFGTPLHRKPLCGPDTEGCVTFLVVHELPVPVHVSWKNGTFPMNTEPIKGRKMVPFHPDELPNIYRHHKYWSLGIVFNGMEM